ncbi:MAG: hypothetical protein COB67_00485 [SAR324 cluster bacterium]|uniref:HNH endonuclease n=1 Tax=SAR324 cluster bacterium TaxID=2024889 RepID=A0A2A4TCW1_9DELT|nr:MAG: hypothetical protein COB67_00485 [SAR324 cluster bacterium]
MVCDSINSDDGIEWHHVKHDSTDIKNHKKLIPLCGHEHHRNGIEISAHGTPVLFRERFSMRSQYALADAIYKEYKEQNTLDE